MITNSHTRGDPLLRYTNKCTPPIQNILAHINYLAWAPTNLKVCDTDLVWSQFTHNDLDMVSTTRLFQLIYEDKMIYKLNKKICIQFEYGEAQVSSRPKSFIWRLSRNCILARENLQGESMKCPTMCVFAIKRLRLSNIPFSSPQIVKMFEGNVFGILLIINWSILTLFWNFSPQLWNP